MSRRNQSRIRIKETYTKKKVNFLLFVGVMGALMPYLLSAFGRDPVVDLGKAWLIEIVAVILGYLLKSYSETKQEKKQELENFKAEQRYEARMIEPDDDPGKEKTYVRNNF